MESVNGQSMVEILNECLKESNLETVSKGELRKKYLEKTGLTKLPREDKKLFSSVVNTAYLNYIGSKTSAANSTDETKTDETSDKEVKENDGDWTLKMSSSSDEDLTPANIKKHAIKDKRANGENIKETSGDQVKENGVHEKLMDSSAGDNISPGNTQENAVGDQFVNGVNDVEMESSSDLDEMSLASYKSNIKKSPLTSTLNGSKKQRGKRALIISSDDEIIHVKPNKRNKVLKKAKRSSDVEAEPKAIMESSDSEDEPLSLCQKKSNSLSGSLNSVIQSNESENECLSKFIKKRHNRLNDSEDESNMFSTKNKTKFIDDLKNHSSDSGDEPLTKDRKCNDSICSDKNSNALIEKKLNFTKKFSKSIESTSGSEDESLAKYSKKKIHNSSDSENEPLNNLSNKKMHDAYNSKKKPSKRTVEGKVKNPLSNSSKSRKEASKKKRFVDSDDDSDEQPIAALGKKSNSVSRSLKSMKNSSDSEDEPLNNLSNKKTYNYNNSQEEPVEKILKGKVRHSVKKPITSKNRSKEQTLEKKRFVDSDDDANISNQKKEKSFNGQRNSLLSDSSEDEPLSNVKNGANNYSDSEDEPLNKFSTKKSEKKQKNSESGSSSSVDENEEQPNKKNKSSKKKVANDSVKEKKRPSASENKIEHLKKYLRVAGIRISNYNKLFENCKTMKAKCEKMMALLEKEGLKGRPTLEKCKKLRLKIETKREIAELDMSNILKEGGGRPKRSVCSDTTNCKQEEKKSTPIKKFSRLQGIVDSEESD